MATATLNHEASEQSQVTDTNSGFLPPDWQKPFIKMLPRIEATLRVIYQDLEGDDRDEAVQEGVVNALLAYRRLCQRGKADLAYPTVLARYAAAQYQDGRLVAEKLNVKDVMSRHCRNRKGVTVQRLDRYDAVDDCWREVLVADKNCTPAELAASRIDYPAFLATLSKRERRIAEALSRGETTNSVARMFRVSASRISQMRRELLDRWEAFHGEDSAVPASRS